MSPSIASQLKHVMRGVAATVTLVTTGDAGGTRHVMIASSFTSVSLAPPTVLVCIARQTNIHAPILATRRFCINILRADHTKLASMCRTKNGLDRFAHEDWRVDTEQNLPYLACAQASLFCELVQCATVGTHSVMIAGVTQVLDPACPNADPLVYLDGHFGAVKPHHVS